LTTYYLLQQQGDARHTSLSLVTQHSRLLRLYGCRFSDLFIMTHTDYSILRHALYQRPVLFPTRFTRATTPHLRLPHLHTTQPAPHTPHCLPSYLRYLYTTPAQHAYPAIRLLRLLYPAHLTPCHRTLPPCRFASFPCWILLLGSSSFPPSLSLPISSMLITHVFLFPITCSALLWHDSLLWPVLPSRRHLPVPSSWLPVVYTFCLSFVACASCHALHCAKPLPFHT